MSIVETYSLTKKFGDFTAVDSLTLDVPKGIFGLIGPNGAGKTTLIKMLLAIIKPTSGQGEVLDRDISTEEGISEIKKHVGYCQENPRLWPDLSGKEYLEFFCRIYGYAKNERERRIKEVFELINLTGWENTKIGKYSAGMRQRLAIGQSFIHDPTLLILDEPTSNLDPLGRIQILKLIKRLNEDGKSVIFCTHVIPDLEQVCDHVGILYKGKLLEYDTTQKIIRKYAKSDTYLLEVSKPEIVEKELKKRDYVDSLYLQEEGAIVIKLKDSKLFRSEVAKLVHDSGSELFRFQPIGETLQDAFERIITRQFTP